MIRKLKTPNRYGFIWYECDTCKSWYPTQEEAKSCKLAIGDKV